MILWRGKPITKVVRTMFRDMGLSLAEVNAIVVGLYNAKEIRKLASPVMVQSQKNRSKVQSGAFLTTDEEEFLRDILAGRITSKREEPANDPFTPQEPLEEPIAPKPVQYGTQPEGKVSEQVARMLNVVDEQIKQYDKLKGKIDWSNSNINDCINKVALMEAKLEEQDEKIKQIEEIALVARKVLEVKLPNKKVKRLDEFIHPAAEYILKLVNGAVINGERHRINVLMVGPAGSGKTWIAGQIAKMLDCRKYGFISCSTGMSESQVTGSLLPIERGGTFDYVPVDFVDIWEHGGLFLFDEFDNSDANMAVVLNAALSGDKLSLVKRWKKPIAKKHPDTIIMAAANTDGTGADRLYAGRNQLDEATLDRFRAGKVFVDYCKELETYLCPDDALRTRLWGYREKIQEAKVRRVISTRFIKEAYIMRIMEISDEKIDEALFGGWKEEEIAKAKGSW